jgi:hypothetical protein
MASIELKAFALSINLSLAIPYASLSLVDAQSSFLSAAKNAAQPLAIANCLCR